MTRCAGLVALTVALAAFALYRATLLPGFDFGDTGSFQATVGSPIITTRDAYPLYFALGWATLRLAGAEPAHALNLASAIEGAMACGLFVFVAAELSGSVAAGAASALLFAVSYTFWSQAVIAEVYSLHIALVALTLLLLLRWADIQTDRRLYAFFAVYALGFGNHLSRVLLLPGYTLFLHASAPGGWRSMFAPRIVLLATMCAVAGALQYGWNVRTLWLMPDPPHSLAEALQRFWFDVTKSDWRDTMVMNVPQSLLRDHLAMYWFDLSQQFGIAGPLLAVAGLVQLALVDGRRAMLMVMLFAANLIFAYSYNVGDAHVFYLPSHLLLALLAAPGLVLAGRLVPHGGPIAAGLLTIYAGTRAYHDFPALDRSQDSRPTMVVDALTAGSRRSTRHPARRPQLADRERPVVFREGDAAGDRLRAHARRPALRAGADCRQPRDRTACRAHRARARDDRDGVRSAAADRPRPARRGATADGDDREPPAGHTLRAVRAAIVRRSQS